MTQVKEKGKSVNLHRSIIVQNLTFSLVNGTTPFTLQSKRAGIMKKQGAEKLMEEYPGGYPVASED